MKVIQKVKELFQNKKGQMFDNLIGLILGLVTIAVVLAVGALILANINSNAQVQADPNASYAISTTLDAFDDIPSWLPLIVVVTIGALIVGLVALFARR